MGLFGKKKAIDRTVEFSVTGMTCSKCVAKVTEILLNQETVKDCSVVLHKTRPSVVTILTDYSLDDIFFTELIENAGYEVVGISRDE